MKKLFSLPIILSALALCLGTATAEEKGAPSAVKPSDGWTLHIDAKRHIPKMPDMVVHHYCKQVSGGLTECQLYDSDKPDARLIGVEMVVDAATFKKFSKKEKALWHYHKTEIPKVNAVLPDLSPEEAAKTLKSMQETYGKVYLLWNPAKSESPAGEPFISILH
jgi:hypothetical protein